MDQSAEDLRCKFSDLLEQHFEEPNRRWLAVWNLFAKHPWYKGQLNGCAHYVLEQSRLPADLEHDIKQAPGCCWARVFSGPQACTSIPGAPRLILNRGCGRSSCAIAGRRSVH